MMKASASLKCAQEDKQLPDMLPSVSHEGLRNSGQMSLQSEVITEMGSGEKRRGES